MKQSDIKVKCEQAYQNIKLQQDEIKRLQSICKHKNHELVLCYIAGHPIDTCMICHKQLFPEWQKLGEIKREDI